VTISYIKKFKVLLNTVDFYWHFIGTLFPSGYRDSFKVVKF